MENEEIIVELEDDIDTATLETGEDGEPEVVDIIESEGETFEYADEASEEGTMAQIEEDGESNDAPVVQIEIEFEENLKSIGLSVAKLESISEEMAIEAQTMQDAILTSEEISEQPIEAEENTPIDYAHESPATVEAGIALENWKRHTADIRVYKEDEAPIDPSAPPAPPAQEPPPATEPPPADPTVNPDSNASPTQTDDDIKAQITVSTDESEAVVQLEGYDI